MASGMSETDASDPDRRLRKLSVHPCPLHTLRMTGQTRDLRFVVPHARDCWPICFRAKREHFNKRVQGLSPGSQDQDLGLTVLSVSCLLDSGELSLAQSLLILATVFAAKPAWICRQWRESRHLKVLQWKALRPDSGLERDIFNNPEVDDL